MTKKDLTLGLGRIIEEYDAARGDDNGWVRIDFNGSMKEACQTAMEAFEDGKPKLKGRSYPGNLLAEIGIDNKPDNFETIIETTLTEREREMIRWRFEECCTFEKIGAIKGITRERARQIVTRAVRKITEVVEYGGY